MLRATLRSLLARKLRLLLSGVAVILGVAFVSGTFVLTDSLGRVFDTLFSTVDAGTSVQVRAKAAFTPVGGRQRDVASRPVPESVLAAVRHVDGVADAVGGVSGFAQLAGRDGKPLGTGGAPTLGVSMSESTRLEALRVKQGRAPRGDDEVAVDAVSARRLSLHPGDRVHVFLRGPARDFSVAGVVGFGSTDNLAGASLVAFSVHGAQRWVGHPGSYTDLSLAAAPGVSDQVLQRRVGAVLPQGFEAITSAQKTADLTRQVKRGLGFFSTALLVFAAVALFVGAFLIFNTFSMLIAQRTRELALMRALGASRGQVTRSVLVEALVVGVLSSLAGFLLGLGVAAGLRGLLGALGITLPSGPTVVAARTVVASFAVGVGITCAAALVPARKAARVSPVEAMRDSGPAEDRSLRRRVAAGAALLATGVGLITYGLTGGGLTSLGIGAMLAFLGVAGLSPLVARPVVLLLGAPLVRLGRVPARLGTGNAARSPRRTSATAAALMVGLALVSAVSVLGSSVKASVNKVIQASLGADFILSGDRQTGLGRALPDSLRSRPGIAAVAALRQGPVELSTSRHGPRPAEITGVEPDELQSVLRLTFTRGDLQAVRRGELAVDTDTAATQGLHPGDTVGVLWPSGATVATRVGALMKPNRLVGAYLVSAAVYDANTPDPVVDVVLVKAAPHADLTATRAGLLDALSAYPAVKVQDQAQFVASVSSNVDALLNGITGLLVLSIVIAVLGIVNTLALSVVERVRELGLLRAVGLQRRQLRRMIRVESVLIAVYGALLGLAIGTAMGFALVTALHSRGITEFTVPVVRLLVIVAGAAVAGVVAAALPARRAARLDVLAAVSSA